ncbi:MAG: S1C family serine protease [Eubacteriales bacterium]
MKEFDMNNQNEMNNQTSDNLNNNYQNSESDNARNDANNVNIPGTDNNVNTANAAPAENPNEPKTVDNSYRREAPFANSENPYFKGYGDYRQTGAGEQNPQTGTNSIPPQQNSQPQYTSRGYGYGGNNYSNNQYQQNNNQYSNQYNHTYNAPRQEQGQISYTPTPSKVKKEKKSKPVSRGVLAAVLALTIVLSGCVGFGGAMLANSISSSRQEVAVDNQSGSSNSVSTSGNASGAGENIVIYRNVDDVDTSTGMSQNGTYSYAEVSAIVKDTVVEINTEFTSTSRGWYNYVQQGAGSGVIISTDGYIITNTHVITDESTGRVADSITVRLTNGDEYDATVKGYDAEADIAIIKIEASGLTAAQCGDSDKLAVGEELVIVGNPLGELGGTVTNGIVSATQREIEVNGVKMYLIQTNAAVNPGNSGGGMFNMKGQLVGIVNAKSSGTGIEGLGFAIPINEALEVTEQLLQYGYVRGKTMIGVTFTEVSSNNFYFYYNIQAGVYVDSCTEGYNDDVLKPGDRVIAVDGSTVSTTSDIKSIVTSASVGDKLKFQIERNGKLMEVEVECFEKVPDNQNSIDFDENGK